MFHLRRIGLPATVAGVKNNLCLDGEVTRIGRHSENDYFLDSSVLSCYISRWHAEVHRINQHGCVRYLLRDNSLNGTYVNDHRIKGNHLLESGDEVTFGHPNGKSVRPGEHAPQPTSEFLFSFDQIYSSEQEKTNAPSDAELSPVIPLPTYISEPPLPSSSRKTPLLSQPHNASVPRCIFPESPSTLSVVLRDISNASKLPLNQGLVLLDNLIPTQEPRVTVTTSRGDESLLEIAQNIQTRVDLSDYESDDDIFDLDSDDDKELAVAYEPACVGTPVTPATPVCNIKRREGKKQSSPKMRKSVRPRKRKLNNDFVSGNKAKRCRSSKKRRTTSGDEDDDDTVYHYERDSCNSVNCMHPRSAKVAWVQCDDCDQWYHTECVRCRYDLVRLQDAEFHCGCAG